MSANLITARPSAYGRADFVEADKSFRSNMNFKQFLSR